MPVKINLSYGAEKISCQLPECRFLGELAPKSSEGIGDLESVITEKLKLPVEAESLDRLSERAGKIAIVVPDHTRVFPTGRVLPVVYNYLSDAGVTRDRITIVVGVGNHRPVTEMEKKKIMGPLYSEISCYHSRETGYLLKGITKRGTPVEIAAPVAEADLVIGMGCIEMHQLTGFSGGVKAVAAGTASPRALQHNHRLKTLQADMTGTLQGNVVREDMEEFAGIAQLRFIINVVMNERNQVVFASAGDPLKVHRIGSEKARELFEAGIGEKADIVIVSPGGEPRDSTVYQAQKSVKNAMKAVKDGGIVILAAKCPEGFGDETFEKWLSEAAGPEDILERSKSEFVLGGHKSVFLASAVKKAGIYMVSDMNPAEVKKMFFQPYASLQEAVDAALKLKGPKASVLVMPWGGLTVPKVM